MSRETPKKIYVTKVRKFGNGASIKAFKSHIGEEVIVMIKKKTKKDIKIGKITDQYIEEYYKNLD